MMLDVPNKLISGILRLTKLKLGGEINVGTFLGDLVKWEQFYEFELVYPTSHSVQEVISSGWYHFGEARLHLLSFADCKLLSASP